MIDNIALLTTETTHHTHFARELRKSFNSLYILSETNHFLPKYHSGHDFEKLRDEYETDLFFGGKSIALKEVAETCTVDRVNSVESLNWFKKIKPALTIVFGTGIVKRNVIEHLFTPILNLHGGDPQEYRGLDSHLWAIFHRDFTNLVTCIHELTSDLDAGAIVEMLPLPIKSGANLHELRAVNTDICVELATNTIRRFQETGKIESHPQKKVGRNYSAMPSCLKGRCIDIFQKYTKSLNV